MKSVVATLPVAVLATEPQAQSIDTQVGLSFHDEYVAQGRSLLPRGGLVQFDLLAESGDLFGGLTILDADSASYEETNWLLGLARSAGNFEFEITLTHLQFREPGSKDSDNEIGAGISYSSDTLTPFAALTYSTSASATWIDLGVATAIDLGIGELSPYLMTGWNQGYIVGESEGINHIQLGLDYLLQLSDSLEFSAYIASSQPLDSKPGDSTSDLFWSGVGVSYSF